MVEKIQKMNYCQSFKINLKVAIEIISIIMAVKIILSNKFAKNNNLKIYIK
jgi:hypothetical protein